MLQLRVFFVVFFIMKIEYLQGQIDDVELRYSVGLSEPLQSSIEWDYDENDDKKLIFQWNITLEKGYCGILAFSSYDIRTDHADVIIFGEDEKIYNGFTDEDSLLYLPENNIELEYNVINKINIENGKKTIYTIRFIRPLDTCDKEKRNYIIDRGTTHLLTGSMTHKNFRTIKQSNDAVPFDIEKMRLTLQRVQLLKSQVSTLSIPNSDPHVDFLNQNVIIPNVETTYWCTRFELPKEIMKKPHHIIRFDGIVSPQSDGVVHHMELFHCDIDPKKNIPPYNEPCTSEEKPLMLRECRRVIGAWALGATNFTYPEEAGGIIGGPESSRFVVLEVHFNNPYLKKNIVDQSGIRLYYTPKLRKYDAGIMEVGLEYNPKNSIPPRAKNFRISGYCPKECTTASLPPKGITVFASQLHTHATGVQAFTRIIRKNENEGIVTLNVDRHYSPHFQEIRLLPEPVKIKQGDAILHTCIYNTESRTNMTFGGYGIQDEMCVNYMHYYPRSELELCKTSVSDEELEKYFKKMKKYDLSETSPDKTVFENYQTIRWTPLTTSILETFYEMAQIHLSCNGSDGNYSPKFNWKNKYFPFEPEERDVPLDTKAKCK